MSSTLYPQTDVNVSEVLLSGGKNSFVDFEPENLRLENGDWGAVDVDQTTALFGVSDGRRGLVL